MPPSSATSRKRAAEPRDDYASDDGFVVDAATPSRSSKKTKRSQDSGGSALRDDDGNEYWELSSKRRVQISDFGKATYVNIREFYEAGGKTLPGKKGIALPIEQFNALIEALPHIEKALKAKIKEAKIARPRYGTADEEAGPGSDVVDDVGEESEADVPVAKKETKESNSDRKANHEATSSEDEG